MIQTPDLITLCDEPTRKIYVVFHFPCKDGFTAAWAFLKGFQAKPPPGRTILKLIGENHRFRAVDEIINDRDAKNAEIIFLDICPKRDYLIKVASKVKSVQVYDHHQTAEECADLPYVYIDKTRSGAGIAWDIFVGGKRPLLVDCVEDGDTWKWKVPNSKEILIVLENVRMKMEEWDKFNDELETDPTRIIEKGRAWSEYRDIVCRMLLGRKIHKLRVGNIVLPATNASIFQSGLGNTMAKKIQPYASAVYYFNGTYWAFSLRSTDRGPDVAKIAEKFGGGGHRNAAGFRLDDLNDFIIRGVSIEPYTEQELTNILDESGLEESDYLTSFIYTVIV